MQDRNPLAAPTSDGVGVQFINAANDTITVNIAEEWRSHERRLRRPTRNTTLVYHDGADLQQFLGLIQIPGPPHPCLTARQPTMSPRTNGVAGVADRGEVSM